MGIRADSERKFGKEIVSQQCLVGRVCPYAGNGEEKVAGKRLSRKNREVFLEGLKRYQDRGIPILIDGKEADASAWEKILEEQSDGSFYMGDYILEEVYEASKSGQTDLARESSSGYMAAGDGIIGRRLKEIRFDRVYNR